MPAKWLFINTANTDQVVDKISAAVKAGTPVLVSSRRGDRFAATMAKIEPRSVAAYAAKERLGAVAETNSADPLAKFGLAQAHEFAVLGVGEKNGKKMVVLRNPWGVYEPPRGGIGTGPTPGYDRANSNGIFALPAEEFGLLFAYATTIDPKGDRH